MVLWKDTLQKNFFKKRLALIKAFHNKISLKIPPLEVERGFLIENGKGLLSLKGYIGFNDNQGTIIDHKTSKKSYPPNSVEKTFHSLLMLSHTGNSKVRKRKASGSTSWSGPSSQKSSNSQGNGISKASIVSNASLDRLNRGLKMIFFIRMRAICTETAVIRKCAESGK